MPSQGIAGWGMHLFSNKKKKLTADLFQAVIHGDEIAVKNALFPEADLNALDAEGLTLLRHAIRNKKLAIMGLLLGHGARPTPECAAALAHWAQRADRSRRFECPNHRGELLRVRTAIRLLDQYGAPWDVAVKSISSGDTSRTAILHVMPGCLSEQPR